MLNISDNSVLEKIDVTEYGAYDMVKVTRGKNSVTILGIFMLIVGLSILFLPWTQNMAGTGTITSLMPEQRPQEINSVISGRIENWYVREGDFVAKGDTLLEISEIKDEYFDPQLLFRTQEQINAKDSSVTSYGGKVLALESQVAALERSLELKLRQAQNKIRQINFKVTSDSMDYVAAELNVKVIERQYDRAQTLYDQGLKSLTDLEGRRMKSQGAQAKAISAQNKLLVSKNELLNAKLELDAIKNNYADKLGKARSDRFSSLTALYESQAEVSKLQNKYSNIQVRQGMYFLTAPQTGYVTKVINNGIGETIKEGDRIAMIMPSDLEYAVEIYIEPMDLPLIHRGNKVRLIFDGWPALVFSGWPGASSGTFGGEVVAVDNFISDNGKYRLLVSPDETEEVSWPQALRIGSGARGMILLNDVSIGYELWRQLNGFPPEFYKPLKTFTKGHLEPKYDTDAEKKGK